MGEVIWRYDVIYLDFFAEIQLFCYVAFFAVHFSIVIYVVLLTSSYLYIFHTVDWSNIWWLYNFLLVIGLWIAIFVILPLKKLILFSNNIKSFIINTKWIDWVFDFRFSKLNILFLDKLTKTINSIFVRCNTCSSLTEINFKRILLFPI
jgi:hypothetical protein